MPAMKPSAGLPGVLGVLVVTSSPESSSNATTSVNVPPVSMPILIRPLRHGDDSTDVRRTPTTAELADETPAFGNTCRAPDMAEGPSTV